MWISNLVLVTLLSVSTSQDIGHFWHISDFHWDPKYYDKDGGCRRSLPGILQTPAPFGGYSCDSPWALVESAVDAMKAIQGDDLEFILWTGDGVSDSLNSDEKLEALKNVTELLSRTFSSQFVFPVLGHTDSRDTSKLGQLWRHWLPTDAIQTFIKGGYYMIEQKSRRLKVIALNTNLWTDTSDEYDPGGQWKWLETLLEKSRQNGETVYLVGHVAPGFDERQGAPPRLSLAPVHNERYIEMARKYSAVITGQFFGHLHSDTFRIVYDHNESDHRCLLCPIGDPVSSILLAPSITPKRTASGANNPALRLYTYDTDTGQVDNYMQYYMDLPKSNEDGEPTWTVEYNFTRYYGLDGTSPTELHDLVQAFTTNEGMQLFGRYWMANSVRSYKLPTRTAWTNAHYCAITQLGYAGYQDCLSTRASALASAPTEGENKVAVSSASKISFWLSSLINIKR